MADHGQLEFDAELRAELERTREVLRRMEIENQSLREQLVARDAPAPSAREEIHAGPSPASPQAKIALFRALFRGRDDVYAQRWEAPDGRHGYSPVLRGGVRRVRGQPIEPAQCLPLTDEAIRGHLEGASVLGVYPLQLDETTAFLAIDLDKAAWRDDVRALSATCEALGVPHAVERSRSGNGAHLWVFFDRLIPAPLARNLGCVILTAAIDRRSQIPFASYDRLFPSQDTLPKGGFGNLIALPLQGLSRRLHKNTVFLTPPLDQPYRDQWAFLASVPRVGQHDVEYIVRGAAKQGRVIGVGADWLHEEREDGRPWELRPSRRRAEERMADHIPASVGLVISHRVFIPTEGMSAPLVVHLRRMAAFQNPEFYAAQRMRLPTFGKPRVISCGEDFPHHLALPRGYGDTVREFLTRHGCRVTVADERQRGRPLHAAFHGELTSDQAMAAGALLKHDVGVLSAPTAFGKTVIGAWLIAQRRINALVLVHRRHLLDQWRERLSAFLELPIAAIGQIGAGRCRSGKPCPRWRS
ncbi:MAG TPA: DEAD/DEAH box helicase family protein [Candidatus Micrarchaeaceae archaeon]|nr:DEAD/DEAH box helicase family protein [Candidatus Micrarchaeaceae archaeon]